MLFRENLREQNALSNEINEAMANLNQDTALDEEELDNELEALQQEQLDEQMLKTGSVPVSDQIQRLPAAGDKPSKCSSLVTVVTVPANAESTRGFKSLGFSNISGTVHTGKQPTTEDEDEEELRKLEAEMAM